MLDGMERRKLPGAAWKLLIGDEGEAAQYRTRAKAVRTKRRRAQRLVTTTLTRLSSLLHGSSS